MKYYAAALLFASLPLFATEIFPFDSEKLCSVIQYTAKGQVEDHPVAKTPMSFTIQKGAVTSTYFFQGHERSWDSILSFYSGPAKKVAYINDFCFQNNKVFACLNLDGCRYSLAGPI